MAFWLCKKYRETLCAVQNHMTRIQRHDSHASYETPTTGSTNTAASQDMSVPIHQFVCSRTHGLSAKCMSIRTDTLYFKYEVRFHFARQEESLELSVVCFLVACSHTAPHAMNLPVCALSRTGVDGHFQCGPCLKLKFRETLENLMGH